MTRREAVMWLTNMKNDIGTGCKNLQHYEQTIDEIIDLIDDSVKTQWTPISKGMPKTDGSYLVSGQWGSGKFAVGECEYSVPAGYFDTAWNFDVQAWKPLPEPYKGELR